MLSLTIILIIVLVCTKCNTRCIFGPFFAHWWLSRHAGNAYQVVSEITSPTTEMVGPGLDRAVHDAPVLEIAVPMPSDDVMVSVGKQHN